MTMNQHWFEIQDLYQRYAEIVDSADWDAWVELFTDDCLYRVQPRENHERGLPLATLSLSSKAMLRDRAYGIRETLFHDPYYQRHVHRQQRGRYRACPRQLRGVSNQAR